MANIMRLGGGSGGGKPKKLLSSLTEGSLVSILEDGKLVPFYVAKHNYEADLNGEGRTLLMRKTSYDSRAFNSSNVNALATSALYAWMNGEYKSMLSGTVQGEIGTTSYPNTESGGKAAITGRGAVFLASLTEFGLKDGAGSPVEGTALPLANQLYICYDASGNAVSQWTRTPVENDTQRVYYASSAGTAGAVTATSSLAVRPCFTLPADMALNTEPYGDGSWGLADEPVLIDTETASTTAKAGVNYTNGIADLTPAQLHEIAGAISANPNIHKYMGTIYYDKGDVHRKITVGDTITIAVNGVNYAFDVIGFNHDALSGKAYDTATATGKAGITMQMHDIFSATNRMNSGNSNSGGWKSSAMRTSTMGIMMGYLPAVWQSIVKAVDKLTGTGASSASGTELVSDKCFLLSEVEILGHTNNSVVGEGEQYAYYKAGNSTVKKLSGAASIWYERSPQKSNSANFCCVDGGGNGTYSAAATARGVSFAICI